MSNACRRYWPGLGVGALLTCLLLLPSAPAQKVIVRPINPGIPGPGGPNGRDELTEAMSLPIDREATQKIEAVKEYLLKKEPPWELITEVLQRLLESPEDKFVEVERKDPKTGRVVKGNKVSVRAEANAIIGGLPAEGLQFYQLTYGPRAEARLKEAIERNDLQLLAEVSERFLHTKAGGEATLLLGTYHLDRGKYTAASLYYQRLLTRPDADKLPPRTLFKAALAMRRAGQQDASEALWKKVASAVGRNDVNMGPKAVSLERLRKELDREVTGSVVMNQSEWFVLRGGLTRNAQGIGGRPFLEPRFAPFSLLPRTEAPEDKAPTEWISQNLDIAVKMFDQRPIVPLPAFFPVASGGKIVFRTYDGVYAIATKDDDSQNPPVKAGEMLWMTSADYSLFDMVKDTGKRNLMDQQWYKPFYYPQNGPYGIFFENGLIGALSHDGTNAYFVDDMAVPPHPNLMMQFGGGLPGGNQPGVFGAFSDMVYHNRLVAVNLETGKVVWKAGGRGGNNANGGEEKKGDAVWEMADSHFLGAPLPLAGKLYVMAEKGGELRLLCIDPNPEKVDKASKHPELVWVQTLGNPNTRVSQDTLRRIQGVHLAYSDGILICPTNSGAVLGVDLLSHSLVWAHSYREPNANPDPQPLPPNVRIRRPVPFPNGQPGMTNLNAERWRASAPIVVNGKVVFTAYDSTSVQCINLRNGELIWKSPRATDDLYVAGVFDNKVVIVAKNSVRALDLNDGKTVLWRIDTGVPSGIGTASKNFYFLPIKAAPDTKEPEIWAIDVEKGKIDARTKSRKKLVAGNLLFYDGDVYSQTERTLTAFPQLQVKLDDMRARLKQNPNDPLGLTDLGELQLDDGKRLDAIQSLKKALTFNPPEATKAKAREKLYEAITELLQYDFGKGQDFLEEYKGLCELPNPDGKPALADEQLRRKATYYCLVAKGREGQGRLVDAFEAYLAFGTLSGNKELLAVPDQPNTTARPDVWARGRIEAMLAKATPDQRKPLEDKVLKEWNEVKDANDVERVRGFVRVFGSMFAVGKQARLLLADKLIATNNEDSMRDAQNILLGLRSSDEPAVAAQATETLARLFIRKGLLEDAVGLYQELGRDYPKVVVRDGKTGADFLNDLLTDKRFLPYLEPLRQAWGSKLRAQEIPGGQAVMPQSSFTIEPEGDLLPFFSRHRVVMDINAQGGGMWQLRVVDRVTNEERFKYFPLQQSQWILQYPQANHRYAQVRGHMLILNLNHMVYAFDLADKKKLWEYNLFGKTPMPNMYPVQQIMEPDGGLRLTYADGWTQKLGQVGVIEPTYICLQTRDGLVALDPARGTVLWTKSNVSSRITLVGDEQHIYVFETNSDGTPAPTRCVRAADGVSVEVPDASALFANPKRLKVYGRNLLVFDEDARLMRLYDIHTGKDVWKKELEKGAVLLRSDDPALIGFVTPKGGVSVFNVRNGQEVFKAKMTKQPGDEAKVERHLAKVNEAHLLLDRERYYVMLNRPLEPGVNVNPNVTNGIRTLRVNGTMYCFDRTTRERLWFTDEQFENQMLILEQFADLPILLAAAQYQKFNNGVQEGYGVKVMAVEKDGGKCLFRREVSQNGQFYALLTNPAAGTIELWRHDLRIKFAPEDGKPRGATKGDNPALGSNGQTAEEVAKARLLREEAVRRQVLQQQIIRQQLIQQQLIQQQNAVPVPVPAKK